MSFNPDKETGTKINYRDVGKIVDQVFNSKYIKHVWIDKYKYVSQEVETEIEPGLAAHEMIARLMDPRSDKQATYYGVNTRMMTLNQRNQFIKEQADALKAKAEEYEEQLKQQYEEQVQAAEEAAKQAAVPTPEETKGE